MKNFKQNRIGFTIVEILIAFAVNNELHEKDNYKNKLKDIADKIDL